MERYAASALPSTDDRPRIEYGEWAKRGKFVKSLLALNDLRVEPPLVNGDAALAGQIEQQRDILLTFYEAGIFGSQKMPERGQKALSFALRKDPTNPYFRWFTDSAPGDE